MTIISLVAQPRSKKHIFGHRIDFHFTHSNTDLTVVTMQRTPTLPPASSSNHLFDTYCITPSLNTEPTDDRHPDDHDLSQSIILPPTPPRRKHRVKLYSHTHHVPQSPEAKEELKSDRLDNLLDDDNDLSHKAKRKPYLHTHHVPNLPDAEAGIGQYLESHSEHHGLEEETEMSAEEFPAELEKLSSNPFCHHGQRDLFLPKLNASDPGPNIHMSSPTRTSVIDELDPPSPAEEGETIKSIHSGSHLSQYKIISLISPPGDEDVSLFLLPKSDTGNGNNDEEWNTIGLGDFCEQEDASEASSSSEAGTSSPSPLGCCCENCGTKARIALS